MLATDVKLPVVDAERNSSCVNLLSFIKNVRDYVSEEASKLTMANIQAQYRTSLKSSFAYEFSDGDINRIQELISELREELVSNSVLDSVHKDRLLKRLEKLQSELHKRVADLDKFWGLLGDAGVALGKFGKDAKPLVDRIRELTKIVWNTQSRAEELPSDSTPPFLSYDDGES